jgi:hypothetical protein
MPGYLHICDGRHGARMSRQELALTSVALAGIGCTVVAALAAWLLINPEVLATIIRAFP